MMGPEASGFWFFTQPTCRRLPPCVIFHAGGDQTVIRAVSEDRPDHPEVDHLAGLGLSGDGRSVNRHLPAETKLGHAHWGSQWGTTSITNDPAGEAPLQLSFFQHLFGAGDTWSTSNTQYCQGVPVGTTQCGTAGTHVGHPSSSPVAGTWLDSGVTAPNRPSQ